MRKTASMRTNLVRVMEGPEVTVEVLHKDGDHVANKQLSNVQLNMNKCSIGSYYVGIFPTRLLPSLRPSRSFPSQW